MKIVTAVVNNPDFIEIQYYTLKKYCKFDYDFIVFNDAKDFPDFTNDGDITIKKQIQDMCQKLNIECINIPNNNHKKEKCDNTRVADSMNYILKYQKKNPDKYLLLDSDMFLIDDFDINKYSQYDCAILLQSRNNLTIEYFWNGVYYFDITKMKDLELLNWNCTALCGTVCDTGGAMQKWLKKHKEISPIYFIKHMASGQWDMCDFRCPNHLKNNTKLIDFLENDVRNKNGKFFCEIYDNVFLHYRAGGNWEKRGLETHKILTNKLKNALL
jgi:hypothetical protein